MAIDFGGIAPAPSLLAGGDGVIATAPVPSLSARLSWAGDGIVLTFKGTTPAPRLSATIITGGAFEFYGVAPAPFLVATVVNPAIITLSGVAPSPRLLAQILTGNVASFIATTPAPTMLAAGYPAYTITFSGTAPAPRLTATLSAAVASACRTWVLNTKKGPLTEYGPEWAMNSYTFFNGKVLGCTSGGIVEIGVQDVDNTTAITARFRTGQDGFESSFHKRLPRIYVSGDFAGDMTFRTITAEGGTRSYLLGWNNATGIVQRRVPVGKGPKSRWWQTEVENVAGADFSVNDVLLYPVKLRRRVQ